MKKWIIGLLLFSMGLPSYAQEHRGFWIKNIDDGYSGQGYCTLVFSLDAADPFDNPLNKIDFHYINGNKVIAKSTMDVPPFGQAHSNQKIQTYTEWPCEEFTELKIVNIWEIKNGRKVRLPLDVAIPTDYQPAKITK